jgi:hypothetical protein
VGYVPPESRQYRVLLDSGVIVEPHTRCDFDGNLRALKSLLPTICESMPAATDAYPIAGHPASPSQHSAPMHFSDGGERGEPAAQCTPSLPDLACSWPAASAAVCEPSALNGSTTSATVPRAAVPLKRAVTCQSGCPSQSCWSAATRSRCCTGQVSAALCRCCGYFHSDVVERPLPARVPPAAQHAPLPTCLSRTEESTQQPTAGANASHWREANGETEVARFLRPRRALAEGRVCRLAWLTPQSQQGPGFGWLRRLAAP